LRNEALILQQVEHHNIVKYIGSVTDDQSIRFVSGHELEE